MKNATVTMWSAVCEVEEHFSKMGGSARFQGYDDRTPLLLLGALVLYLQADLGGPSDSTLATSLGAQIERRLSGSTAADADLRGCESWVPLPRFSDALLRRLLERLTRSGCDTNALRSALLDGVRHVVPKLGNGRGRAW